MAISSFDPRQPKIQAHAGGSLPQIVHNYLEGNGQSFKAGQFVYFSSGAVTVTGDGDTPVAGIALKDGTSVSASNVAIPVQLLTPETEVLIQVTTGGTLQAANTTCVPGIAYDLESVSTNLHYIDSADTSNEKFVYIDAVYDVNGDATYWGRFRPYAVEAQMIESDV